MIAAGAIKIKHMLPKEVQDRYDPSKTLDKGGVKNLIADIITHGGKEAGNTISKVSNEFFGQATYHGFSTPLDDYYNNSEDRKVMIQEFETKIDAIEGSDLSREKKDEQILDVTQKYEKLINKQNLDHLLKQKSTAAMMAETKARGNPNQLMQGTSTPMISKRIDNSPIPLAITRSYSEGLTPAQQLSMSYWGRGNTVAAQLSTSRPGEMFKAITPNVFHEVVTVPDCHTSNGIKADIDDKRAVFNRYEAGTNKLLDENYIRDLKQSGKKSIKVRSTMTCEAEEGVCQKCYGYDSRGALPDVGENVGVIASQSMSEVLTQMVLSTKHDAKAGKKSNPFDMVSNLLSNPRNFQDKATIAKLNGKVTDITETALKDHKVYINGVEHFIPRIQPLKVEVGDSIKQGQPLCDGTIDPRELVSLRGIGDGRKYMSEELARIYDDAGNRLDKRHFELVSKNMIKHVKVKDPGNTDFMPDQVVSVNTIQKSLSSETESVHVNESAGKKLAKQYLHLTPGTVMDKNHIDELKRSGINEVVVSKHGLELEHIVPGIKSLKQLDENWISKLTLGHQAKTLKDAVSHGQASSISSTDPVAAYVMGSDFGEGSAGRY